MNLLIARLFIMCLIKEFKTSELLIDGLFVIMCVNIEFKMIESLIDKMFMIMFMDRNRCLS